MRRVNRKGLFGFVESYYFGSLIYIASVSAIVLWSLLLIVGPVSSGRRQVAAHTHLAVSNYQPTHQSEQSISNTDQPKVLAAQIQQPEQPALETWQGPIEPI